MLPILKLLSIKNIVTHANCPDGIASALILRHVLPKIPIHFLAHGTPEYTEMAVVENTLFCDFTPPPERVKEFVDAGCIVLDHHEKQKDVVSAFGENGIYADEPGVSGAMLAYQHVWKPIALRGAQRPAHHPHEGYLQNAIATFAEIAGVRDTWQKQSMHWSVSGEQAAMLRFYPIDELLEDEQFFNRLNERMEIGRILVKNRNRSDAETAKKAWRFKTKDGTKVAVVSTIETSDIAELFDDVDLVVGFKYRCDYDENRGVDGKIQTLQLSMRTRGGYDCGVICKANGGGGHRAAAGCHLDVTPSSLNPYRTIFNLIDDYEQARPF